LLRDDEKGWKQALQVLQQALELEPSNSWAMAQAAICQHAVDRPQVALETAERALELDAGMTWLHCLRSLILAKLGRTGEAERLDAQSLAESHDADAYVHRGEIYANLGAYDRAIRDYESAMDLDPDAPYAYNLLAWLYVEFMNADLEKATDLAQKGVDLARAQEDESVVALILDTLGWAYHKRGMTEEAIPLLQEATELLPEDLEIAEHLAACRSATE
jgi:tetratricopeptide (TPR) repeat protein